MLKFSVLCLVAFVVGTLAIADEQQRIVGGQQANRGQFPYQVMLRRISQRAHYCSGAIISDRFVLTTATCAQGRAALPINVRIAVGAHHRLNDGTLLTVSRITNHPQFDRRTMRNNICIIQTTDKIAFTPLIQPAKLPAAVFLDKTGTVLTVSGWGQNHVSHFGGERRGGVFIFSWRREKLTNFYISNLNRRAIQPPIHPIIQISCNFCAQEATNGAIALARWVDLVDSFTRTPFARPMLNMKAPVWATMAAPWYRWTIHWSDFIRGDPVFAAAESQISSLLCSRTSNSSEKTWPGRKS